MQLFYAPDILGSEYILSEEESTHAVRVLRKKEGDRIQLVDGQGGMHEAELIVADSKNCKLKILSSQLGIGKQNFNLHMAVAPTKNHSRYELMLEKMTEIGVDELTPVICKRSERSNSKTSRLEKVAISAMKQSGRAYLPKINDPVSLMEFATEVHHEIKLIAHCQEENISPLKEMNLRSKNIVILIGPEGDFTSEEISATIDSGFSSISLGDHRLRTETAAIVACHTVNLLSE